MITAEFGGGMGGPSLPRFPARVGRVTIGGSGGAAVIARSNRSDAVLAGCLVFQDVTAFF